MDRLLTLSSITRNRTTLQRKKRTCLMCGKSFMSAGSHNRRCAKCNELLDRAREGTYYQPAIYSNEYARYLREYSILKVF